MSRYSSLARRIPNGGMMRVMPTIADVIETPRKVSVIPFHASSTVFENNIHSVTVIQDGQKNAGAFGDPNFTMYATPKKVTIRFLDKTPTKVYTNLEALNVTGGKRNDDVFLGYGEEAVNGYTILGETVGEGFDVMSMLSGFLKKDSSGPSQVQQLQMMQQQQEAQRAREAAARAKTAAWIVGGITGTGLLGLILWKVLAR